MPFVAGQSGNPLGRPPDKYSIRSILKRIGNQVLDTSAGKMRKAELMWTAIYNEAIKGNVKAAFLIADRLEGRAPQSIDITTLGERMQTTQAIIRCATEEGVEAIGRILSGERPDDQHGGEASPAK